MPDDDLIAGINSELDATGVYVAPSLASTYPADLVARMREDVANSPVPLRVVVYPFDHNDQFNGDPGQLLSLLHDASDAPGVYLTLDDPFETEHYWFEVRTWDSTEIDSYMVDEVVEHKNPQDAAQAFELATELIASEQLQVEYSALPPPDYGTDEDGGAVSGGVVVTGLVLLALVGAAVAMKYRGKPKKGFVVPPAVVERIRSANVESIRQEADEARLALGERIDEADMGEGQDTRHWQEALDSYEATSRLLAPEAPNLLDAVGAIVLCAQGSAALDRALGVNTEVATQSRCYFHPLHGPSTDKHLVKSESGSARVPLCKACLDDVQHGRQPDILDLMVDGKAVHYFDSDIEPWASTGFGSLLQPGDRNLVTRLQTRRAG